MGKLIVPICDRSFIFTSRLDVGGTVTDSSRFNGRYDVVYETTLTTKSPQFEIGAVAAEGGPYLTFRNGLPY